MEVKNLHIKNPIINTDQRQSQINLCFISFGDISIRNSKIKPNMVFKHHHASSGYFYHGAAVIWLSIERGVGVKWEWKWGFSMSLRLCSFQGYGKYGLLVTPRTIIFLFPLLVCIGTITQPMCMFHGLL